jgi:hypothetical protein
MQGEYETLVSAGEPVRGFCWYPSIDSTDWSNHCTACTSEIDPQGLWSLDPQTWDRLDTPLSEAYSRLCRGEQALKICRTFNSRLRSRQS